MVGLGRFCKVWDVFVFCKILVGVGKIFRRWQSILVGFEGRGRFC